MLLAGRVEVFMVDSLCVTSFQSEGKPVMLWDAFFYKIYQTSKGAFTLAIFRYSLSITIRDILNRICKRASKFEKKISKIVRLILRL